MGRGPKKRVKVEANAFAALLAEEAAKSGLDPQIVRSRNRQHHVSATRKEVVRRAYYELGMTMPQIGEQLGRDASTVHALLGRKQA